VTGVQTCAIPIYPLGNGTTPRNGTIITTWKDKSGNNRDAISNGSPIIRSKQIVFNGINQSFKILVEY
jgi:hypothetical protein